MLQFIQISSVYIQMTWHIYLLVTLKAIFYYVICPPATDNCVFPDNSYMLLLMLSDLSSDPHLLNTYTRSSRSKVISKKTC